MIWLMMFYKRLKKPELSNRRALVESEDHIEGVLTFEEVTDNIRVAVQSYFLNEHSKPENNEYFWAYRVKVINESNETIQLLNRHWIITDGQGVTKEVQGVGVIGEQPYLEPSQHFVYTSGTPLETPTGFMKGSYQMRRGERDLFDVAVPTFSLDSPHCEMNIN